jgi:hypothetical protein
MPANYPTKARDLIERALEAIADAHFDVGKKTKTGERGHKGHLKELNLIETELERIQRELDEEFPEDVPREPTPVFPEESVR